MERKEEEFNDFGWYILDAYHNPVQVDSQYDFYEWKDVDDRRSILRQEYINYTVFVSTIFLGLDHRKDIKQKPLLFETMVFSDKHPELDRDGERYTTYEHALIGHQNTVMKIKLYLNKLKVIEDAQKDSTSILQP